MKSMDISQSKYEASFERKLIQLTQQPMALTNVPRASCLIRWKLVSDVQSSFMVGRCPHGLLRRASLERGTAADADRLHPGLHTFLGRHKLQP